MKNDMIRRNIDIWVDRRFYCMSYAAIGAKYAITKERARQIYLKVERSYKNNTLDETYKRLMKDNIKALVYLKIKEYSDFMDNL